MSTALMYVEEIRTDQLVRDPHNRVPADLDGLTNSIQAEGIRQPLKIRRTETIGVYMICDGERRYTAAHNLGFATVPCIMSDEDPVAAVKERLLGNLHRLPFSSLEEARVFAELRDDHGWKQADIAATAGVSQPHVSKALSLLTLPDEAQTALQEGRLTKETALKVVGLLKHDERMKTVLSALQGDDSPAALEKLVTGEVGAVQVQKNRDARAAAIRSRVKDLKARDVTSLTKTVDEKRREVWAELDDDVPDDDARVVAYSVNGPSVDPTSVTLWRVLTEVELAAIAAPAANSEAAASAEAGDGSGNAVAVEPSPAKVDDGDPLVTLVLAADAMGRLRNLAAVGVVHTADAPESDLDLLEYIDGKIALARGIEPAAAEDVGDGDTPIREDGGPEGETPSAGCGTSPSPDESAIAASENDEGGDVDATLSETSAIDVGADGGSTPGTGRDGATEAEASVPPFSPDEVSEPPADGVSAGVDPPAPIAAADTVGKPPWTHYDEATVPDILTELDFPSCTDALVLAVREYEIANGGRAAILSHCVHMLAGTSQIDFAGNVRCSACGIRPPMYGSTVEGIRQCEECAVIEDRRSELRAEFNTDPGPKRCEEIQRELDGLFVEQYQVEPGDHVDDNGHITRAADITEVAS